MLTCSSFKSVTLTLGGPSLLPTVTLLLPQMTAVLSLLTPVAPLFSSFSADDLVSCILKMKAVRRKPLHVPVHLRPYSLHFPVCCDHCLCSSLCVLFPFSCQGHCILQHHPISPPACQPACMLPHQCVFPIPTDYSFQHIDVLKYRPSLKTATKTSPTPIFFHLLHSERVICSYQYSQSL